MDQDVPGLFCWRATGRARAVVLVLHGGAEWGDTAVRPWRLAFLRMVPFAMALHRAGGPHGVHVALLRNRVRGWNEPRLDPVLDARWALERIRAEHPGLPVLLVGHSMGGRAALRVADDPAVTGVCALAPWTPKDEPVGPVDGRTVVLAHGTLDRVTSPTHSHAYGSRAAARAARLARFEVSAEGHAMLRRPAVWSTLVRGFVVETLGLPGVSGSFPAAWARGEGQRLRIPL
ncbi:alpha/beta hydrolase [Amycolatopsis cihanbeyliensis]|uniref:Serine aminopeptidase S33 family n=1 Tax=Amycolatopsis cihanbeyliensis TaxID=1128664 RepID=A0A542CSN2_AMYCI|nr:alpha/beta hydrolase [Amycolatopsis cihanbeyliensis]TQI93838.1 serine aminopeptidase S33 family [Amycolatopsis cihanbeyliensis]